VSFPFRTISAFSAVSPPFESCEIDEQDQQQEQQQFHTSLPFRRVSVMALLVLSLSCVTTESLPSQAGFHIGKATYSGCLSSRDEEHLIVKRYLRKDNCVTAVE